MLTRISEGLRHTDMCGPYGDSEILSVLPGATIEGATIAAERLGAKNGVLMLRGVDVAVFVGLAELEPTDDSIEGFLMRARTAPNSRSDLTSDHPPA